MVINLDQIQSKYVPGCNKTQAPKGIKSVSVAGSTDKRTITATFNITIDSKCRCRSSTVGKLQKAYHRSPFLIVFWYQPIKSNTVTRGSHHHPLRKKATSKSQSRSSVPSLAYHGYVQRPENTINLEKVPVNLSYLFQLLDVQGGPNGHAKRFMKKFTLWYAHQVKSELDKGKKIEEIDISMKLSIPKPLHAKWLIDLCNYMTSPDGQAVSLKGWKVARVTEAV